MNTARELLFGFLALQDDSVSGDDLIAGVQLWLQDKSRSLADILVEQQWIDSSKCELLKRHTEKYLQRHGNDPQKSLASLTSHEQLRNELSNLADKAPADRDLDASVDGMEIGDRVIPWSDVISALAGNLSVDFNADRITNSAAASDDSSVPPDPQSDGHLADTFLPPEGVGEVSSMSIRQDTTAENRGHRHASSDNYPKRIGKYRILRELGKGGMGTVYEAIEDGIERRVALKVPGRMSEADQLRFEWEARILAQFQDPNIATLYEHGTASGSDGLERQYFAMELVEGFTLSEYVKKTEPDLRRRIELVRRIADAVGRAHRRGIIHRDLKPGNILVSSAGEAKILDFGVARFTEGRPDVLQTVSGQIVGTVAYMSPEQARGDSDRAGTFCDVYALGTILYELLAERHPLPLKGKSLVEMLRTIELEEPVALATINRQFRGDLDIIVSKTLRKDSSARYATAADFADDLGRWLEHSPIAARRPTLGYQLQKLAQRYKLATTAIVGVLATATIAGVLVVRAWQDESVARKDADERRKDAQTAQVAAVVARDEAVDSEKKAVEARRIAEDARRRELQESLVRLQQRGNWKGVLETIATLDTIEGIDRDEVATNRAVALFVLGRYEESRTILDDLGKRDAEIGNCKGRARLYRALVRQTVDGQSEETQQLISHALESGTLSPGDAKFAEAFRASNRDEVEQCLRDGLQAEPFNYLCITYLSLVLVSSGDAAEARSLVTLAAMLFPEDPQVLEIEVSLRVREIGDFDVADIRREAELRMDPAEVDRVISMMQANFETMKVMNSFLEAFADADRAKAAAAQRQVLFAYPKLLTSQTNRRTNLSAAPLPGLDSGLVDIAKSIPIALVGIGRDSVIERCRENFQRTGDPILAIIAFTVRTFGASKIDSVPTEHLQELVDLMEKARHRPCMIRQVPHVLRLLRNTMVLELSRRADAAGETQRAEELRAEVISEARSLMSSPMMTPRQRSLLLIPLIFEKGKEPEVRSIGDEVLAAVPDDAIARIVVAMTEVVLGNPSRADRLLEGVLENVANDDPLRPGMQSMVENVKARIRDLRSEATLVASLEIEAKRKTAIEEILQLSRSYDRWERPQDAITAVRAAEALCTELLLDPSSKENSAKWRSGTLMSRAVARWRLEKFDESCDDWLAAIDADPGDQWPVFVAAPRLLLAGRRDEFNRLTKECLDKYGRSDDPSLCERSAKIALLQPNPETLDQACAAADRSLELGKKHSYVQYFQIASGTAAVRRGKYDAVKGAKGAPFGNHFEDRGFLRFPSVISHAIGARGTTAEPEARQRLLEIAPYFSHLKVEQLAIDHDLMNQLIWYRQASELYQLEPVLQWRDSATWRVPTEIRGTDSAERPMDAVEDGALCGNPSNPADRLFLTLQSPQSMTAFQLEALPDSRLPHNGPGTLESSGRCRISEIVVTKVKQNQQQSIKIAWAIPGSDESPQGLIGSAFDENVNTQWGPDYDDRPGQPLDGVFVLSNPVQLADGEELRIEIRSRQVFGMPLRVRLRTTDKPAPF